MMLTLLPIMAVVFMAFFITGLTIPALPLHVHQGLGLSTFVVGLVAGAQFAAALISRFWSGRCADTRGAKRAVVIGLIISVVAGLLYHVSLVFSSLPTTSVSSSWPPFVSGAIFSNSFRSENLRTGH